MKTKILLFGMTLFLLTFSSCNKDDLGNSSALTSEEATVTAKIDVITDDVSQIIDDEYNAQAGRVNVAASFLPDCATVTTVVSGNTWTRTVHFETTGCTMPNGNILRGDVIVSGSTDFNQSSHTITYSFSNFYHNDKLIQGGGTAVRTLESTTEHPNLHPFVHLNINITVTYPNGNVYTRVGNRTREMVEGYETPSIWNDNVFVVTGNWTTTLPNGGTQTATITTPLRIRMNCIHILSGVITITRNAITAVLDYGNGDCDNMATVTIYGVVYPIILGN